MALLNKWDGLTAQQVADKVLADEYRALRIQIKVIGFGEAVSGMLQSGPYVDLEVVKPGKIGPVYCRLFKGDDFTIKGPE